MAREPISLRGRVVAITGAARGIGRATAGALVSRGAKVAIGDLDSELGERTARELGGETIALELDVTDRESFARFLEQVEERLGPLDVLVNNAGIMPLGLLVDEDDATARRLVDINLHGVLFGVKLALPGMLARGSGHIVNIASQAGKAGLPGGATYCATKHAVVGLSEALRSEVDATGVEVSCVMPAIVNTELAAGLQQARGVKTVEPEDVAAEIASALERPRFEVFVPRSSGAVQKLIAILPRRAREAMAKAMNADRILAGADFRQRASYEERAARSEPALDEADAGGGSQGDGARSGEPPAQAAPESADSGTPEPVGSRSST